jgi:Ca2+-binding RTX toxin-like protein
VSGTGTWDNDVFKTTSAGFITSTTTTQDANLTFTFNNLDSDGDTTATQTLDVTVEGSNTFLGTASAESIQGTTGNDTITGAGGADILTGNGGADTFKYLATSDSTIAFHDVIEDFDGSSDIIDLTAIAGITNNATFSASTPVSVAAHSIVFYQSGSDTIILANASNSSESAPSADMMMVLTGVNASTLSATAIHQ